MEIGPFAGPGILATAAEGRKEEAAVKPERGLIEKRCPELLNWVLIL